jgi:hypothetical protein
MIHEAACGHLRDIDRIATGALKRAARKKLKRIDRAIVEAVATQDHATIDSADANDGPRL